MKLICIKKNIIQNDTNSNIMMNSDTSKKIN